MRKDKDFIFKLRREGKSYRDIQEATGVSRGTLCEWFKGEEWSKHITNRHNYQSIERSKERMIKMNMVRKLKLQYKYALVEKEAEKEYETYKKEPLFWAGLMLYAGEGEKRSKHLIRVSNCEFYIHKIFIKFIGFYLALDIKDFKYSLIIYPDNNPNECVSVWSKDLGAPSESFYKPHVIQGKEGKKRLQYGTCISIISNTAQKKKLLKWLSLAENERFENAVIV
ncbi:MAG: helix-turn-helix domain-containing protein [Candidatus Pacebacteria bacterium]|nr:helix-turn-helix domain-containing protein [Candidatus Paceibacterota bacterium]